MYFERSLGCYRRDFERRPRLRRSQTADFAPAAAQSGARPKRNQSTKIDQEQDGALVVSRLWAKKQNYGE
jgi:hypothetical protein